MCLNVATSCLVGRNGTFFSENGPWSAGVLSSVMIIVFSFCELQNVLDPFSSSPSEYGDLLLDIADAFTDSGMLSP